MEKDSLESIRKLFQYYKSLGDKTLVTLNDQEVFWQPNAESNSIAVIVKHISGNMLSRWTNFMTEDGEKPWRDRDGEFEADYVSLAEMKAHWEEAWACLFNAIDPLQPEDLTKLVYIRNHGHTVVEAIHRQMAHYAYHIGQLVFVAKILKGENWQSLSVPKGKSKQYNQEKFGKEKRRQHFTDDL